MASNRISPTTNGSAQRKCQSWIDRFVEFTDNLEAPVIFRKWSAIAAIAAALEQRVWVQTFSRLYPNLYTVLVGDPGVGKSSTISQARTFLDTLEGLHIAPTSMTKAALVDCLSEAKRVNPTHTEDTRSMTLLADEWGLAMPDYKDGGMIPALTSFYDPTTPYGEWRRGGTLRVAIERPQLNILAGSTPSNLMEYMPAGAWNQGFTSRLMLVYSGETSRIDDFERPSNDILPADMLHDIRVIFTLCGKLEVTREFRDLVDEWRDKDEKPKPTHPKLAHYNTRRRAHLYKLSMVSAVDRGDDLVLNGDDFGTALGWLREIEAAMPNVFTAGSFSVDARAMDEIEHFVSSQGRPVPERSINRFASNILPIHSVGKALQLMCFSGRLKQVGKDPNTYTVED